MPHLYMEYLRLKQDLRSKTVDAELDPAELKFLEAIALLTHQSSGLTVSEAINKKELGSNSTLHKRLYRLIDLQFIELYFQDNHRTKYVKTTEKCRLYFKKESEILKKLSVK